MRARYVVRITPDDVGRRVTVRARSQREDGSPVVADTVGFLQSWEAGLLRIERRDGTVTTLDERNLLAARVVPPAPPPRRKG